VTKRMRYVNVKHAQAIFRKFILKLQKREFREFSESRYSNLRIANLIKSRHQKEIPRLIKDFILPWVAIYLQPLYIKVDAKAAIELSLTPLQLRE
jgi:hypothetical protein